MTRLSKNSAGIIFFVVFSVAGLFVAGVSGQIVYARPNPSPTPFMQPIVIQSDRMPKSPDPQPTPLIKKTSEVSSTSDVSPNQSIPGFSGILFESMDGKVLRENHSDYVFNPASNVKIATAYAVLKTFGADYRFPTNLFYDGELDRSTATLRGNLYVSGRDPSFNYEHAILVADALNRAGIRFVEGDLIVTDRFVMNFSASAKRSGESLNSTMNSQTRSAAATRAWLDYLAASGRMSLGANVPSVVISGVVSIDSVPTARYLLTHESAPLKEIVKATLCYSNNFLSEKLGDMLGGPYAIARFVQLNASIQPNEFSIQTASGLGINRVTPRAMMRLLRVFRNELARNRMTFADVMPVAGVDPGTLERRFDAPFQRGSIVAKTGTLGSTDGGVSALSGEMQTRAGGKILFVIFNQRGGVNRFRTFQDNFVTSIQEQWGGAVPVYATTSLAWRLANTRISYGQSRARVN
jgi:D-alanyl-D-alanine carboxypeptidase/D-alanyl-D-alanine-endopeptidase (penicillin-binding protein 4)